MEQLRGQLELLQEQCREKDALSEEIASQFKSDLARKEEEWRQKEELHLETWKAQHLKHGAALSDLTSACEASRMRTAAAQEEARVAEQQSCTMEARAKEAGEKLAAVQVAEAAARKELSDLELSLSAKQQNHEAAIAKMKTEHDSAVRTMKAEHEAGLERTEANVRRELGDSFAEQLRSALHALDQDHAEALARAKEAAAKEAAEAEAAAALAGEAAAAAAAAAREVLLLRDQLDEALRALDAERRVCESQRERVRELEDHMVTLQDQARAAEQHMAARAGGAGATAGAKVTAGAKATPAGRTKALRRSKAVKRSGAGAGAEGQGQGQEVRGGEGGVAPCADPACARARAGLAARAGVLEQVASRAAADKAVLESMVRRLAGQVADYAGGEHAGDIKYWIARAKKAAVAEDNAKKAAMAMASSSSSSSGGGGGGGGSSSSSVSGSLRASELSSFQIE
jgi:hypothetical protein